MLRLRKKIEMRWSVFTPSPVVITPRHFSARGRQQVGKQWTANLILRKWWQDLVKMTQLMMTFVEHFANSLAHYMVVDVRKMSMLFDSTSSLWSITENKYVDLSALPPCQSTLKRYILRAKRLAYLMIRSSIAQVEEPPLSDCSWDHEVYPVLSRSCYLTAITLMNWRRGRWRVFWRWLYE